MKSFALILSLLGLIAPSACEKSQETDTRKWLDWKVPMSVELNSIQVLAPANAEIIFESHKHNSEDEPAMQVFGAVEADCGYGLTFTSRTFNVDNIFVSNETEAVAAKGMELTVAKTAGEASRAPSSGPWWPAVVVAILSGFGLKGGRLNFEGRGGLLCLTLLSLWTLTLAACPETVTIKVSVPSSVCFNAMSESSIEVWPCPTGASQADFLEALNSSTTMEPKTSAQVVEGCRNWDFDLTTDQYGWETKWELLNSCGHMISSGPPAGRNYDSEQRYFGRICLQPGQYTFILKDQNGDGLCCEYARGSATIKLEGKLLLGATDLEDTQFKEKKISFKVDDFPDTSGGNWQDSMTARDRCWLNAHNAPRRKYNGGKGFVPMKWSKSLKADAEIYAKKLAENCKNPLKHAKGLENPFEDGENLARNSGSGSYGKQRAPASVLYRFVDREIDLLYPDNGHYTQVVWRPTKYVGCGESMKDLGDNKKCRVQVCRYTPPGNCNVINGKWRALAWKDESPCGRKCPADECFADECF